MDQMTISEIIQGYKQKTFSPGEITTFYLQRIKSLDHYYSAFITVPEDEVLARTEISEKKLKLDDDMHLLEGIPVTYKDIINTKGIRTTNGSQLEKEYIPRENAEVVKTLNDAGAINIGKVNLHEYAFGITSDNPFYGSVKNPWNTKRIAGGSSGGSAAAVAANFCLTSIGTDTAGSIRIPAACTGVLGIKPTYGMIDVKGIFPLSWTLDHAGPIAQNAEDLSIVMQALTKKSYQVSERENLKGFRVGIPKQYFNVNLDPAVSKQYYKALKDIERLGADLIEVDVSFIQDVLNTARNIATPEVGYVHKERVKSSLELYSNEAKKVFERSRKTGAHEYIDALQQRRKMTAEVTNLFGEIDVLITPTVPHLPVEIGTKYVELKGTKEAIDDSMIRNTCVFNITGHPALSIPCGLSDDNIPVGLQLIGNYYEERKLLELASIYEKAYLQPFYLQRSGIC
ncbi:amidase [Alteribacillus bidgolensis]|uniref:Aspartyl-tRNA(Asn)/glutamyl-tRNA(Gln) amidotransferase subunit A n=1 Tax=Alteribacillus bidgolensis TaxID=930129 RepID=A0A1G8H307_9BACI|nr:amidase [Alteribacillus bidgolensis]SDI01062.1 aspartyl-tRNA(Asn)/glutamyl-tRNA(Gln) amidotransferase subunit A [Alteribacillus bidgolensis]